jgi:hypothetical protein
LGDVDVELGNVSGIEGRTDWVSADRMWGSEGEMKIWGSALEKTTTDRAEVLVQRFNLCQ